MERPKRLKLAKPAALMMAEAAQRPSPTRRWQGLPALHPDAPGGSGRCRGREPPLLVRGGFIRQVSAGLWTYLPLGWRVHQKAVQIVREEMNAIGGQEMLMPVLTPAELWEASGPLLDPRDLPVRGSDRPAVRPPDDARGDGDLPRARDPDATASCRRSWYHFQTKDRDEPRPRGGLLRVREFIMKDAYSFDRDEEGLDRSFERSTRGLPADLRALRARVLRVQAESGMMGGSESVDFLAPSGSGENTLVTLRERRLRGRPRGGARRSAAARVPRSARRARGGRDARGDDDRGAGRAPRHRPAATSKAMPVVTPDGTLVLALVRGDDRLERGEARRRARPRTVRPATEDEIRDRPSAPTAARSARSGSPARSWPTRRCARAVRRRRQPHRLAPARRRGGPRLRARFADMREPREGDACPRCGGALHFQTAIEVGHIFKLGTLYSEPLGATFLDEDGRSARSSWAATASGRVGSWPRSSSSATTSTGSPGRARSRPTTSTSLPSGRRGPRPSDIAERVATSSRRPGLAVLLDDRDLRPGEKFADADLLGCPVRVTVGKKTLEDGSADVLRRVRAEEQRIAVGSLVDHVKEVLDGEEAPLFRPSPSARRSRR